MGDTDAPRAGPSGPSDAPRWLRGLLRLALRSWPERERRALGPGLLDTACRLLVEASREGRWTLLRHAAGEAAALLRTGLELRVRRAAGKARGILSWLGRLGGGLGADLRFALRTLRRSPAFTAVAVTTLALGVGAQGAIFALVDRVLLRPLPYENPDELVVVWNSLPGSGDRVPVAGPDAAALEARSRTLEEVAFTVRGVDGVIDHPDGARHVRLAAVTVDFFDALGVDPALGRTFDVRDGPGGSADATALVLAERLWRRDFGADPSVIGRTVRVNGVPATIVGVMPASFALELAPSAGVATDIDVWLPLTVPLTDFHRDGGRLLDQDSDNSGAVVARLASGASLEAARREAERVAAELRREVPAYAESGLGFDVRSLHGDATGHARGILATLFAGMALVLVVVCLNLGTLLLARRVDRGDELAVRAALGASRGRLGRQLAVEGAVLVGAGALAALLVADAGAAALARLAPPSLIGLDGLALDGRAAAFVGVVSAGVGALVAVGALASSGAGRRSGRALRGGRGERPGVRARSILVSAEIALSVALVLAAGLLLRTVDSLDRIRPGFEPESALTFSLSLRVPDRYRSPARRAELMREIEEEIRALPRVRDVGLAGVLPLSGDRWTQPYGLPGQPEEAWHRNRADFRVVTSGYFDAIGTRLLAGRSFTRAEDLDEEERVVVVDERLARRIAAARADTPGSPSAAGSPGSRSSTSAAVGAEIGIPLDGAGVRARVVGVVEHVRRDALDADGREAVYVPYRQEASRDVAFVVRTEGDPLAVADPVRRIVRTLDPSLPVHDVRSLRDYVAAAVAPRRFALASLTAFSLLALLCSAVGLYGVVSYDVERGRRDLGVRIAVGAGRRQVMRSVLLRGARIGAPGVAAGVLLGAVVARGLRSLVYGVGVADPVTWATTLLLVAAVTAAACAVPAWRAGGTDPATALRAN